MKKPAAVPVAAPKRNLTSAEESVPKRARSVPDRPVTAERGHKVGDLSELRRKEATAGEELREAEAEQTAQRTKLKQSEKDAKDAREALNRLESVVSGKRAAHTELTRQVSAAVRANGVAKVSVPLGQPVFYKATDVRYDEDDPSGGLECNISVTVQAECYQVMQFGRSAKVIRYDCSSKASESISEVPMALEEPKKPRTSFIIWQAENRDALEKEAGTKKAPAVGKLASQKWKDLGEVAKQPYHQKAFEAKRAYDTAVDEFVKAAGLKGSKKIGKKERKRQHMSDFVVSCKHQCDVGGANGTVVCTTMAGCEVCRFAVPPGEDALGMWLPQSALQSISVPKKCRLRLIDMEGMVFWTQADDAVRPLVNSMEQLDRLKKQYAKEGRIIAATEQAATKAVLQALNFGDDACLGNILLGSFQYAELSSLMPKLEHGRFDDDDALMSLKAKLVRGLDLQKLVSNFIVRQCQRGVSGNYSVLHLR